MIAGLYDALALCLAGCTNAVLAFFLLRKAKRGDAKFWFSGFLLSCTAWAFTHAIIRAWSPSAPAPNFLVPLVMLTTFACPATLTCFALDFITDKGWPKLAAWLVAAPFLVVGTLNDAKLTLDPSYGWLLPIQDLPLGFMMVGLGYILFSQIAQICMLAYVVRGLEESLLRRKMLLFIASLTVYWLSIIIHTYNPNGSLTAAFWLLAALIFWEAFRIGTKRDAAKLDGNRGQSSF